MIAIPRLQLPALGRPSPRVRRVAQAVALAGLVVALAAAVAMLAPRPRSAGMTIPLDGVVARAPAGWAAALGAAHGSVEGGQEVIRLWDRPPAKAASRAPLRAATAAGRPDGPLPAAPVAGLFTMGPGGPLPIIAPSGLTPFEAYRRPFAVDGRPRVALVIRGLGLNAQATRAAIESLPPDVTLSFVVYADNLQDWIDQARARGHEVLLEAPMEPVDYPDNDPGPYTLMAQGQPQETVQRLEWILSRASGYFGVTNYLGERFLGSPAATGALAAALRGRGLGFVDDGLARGRAGGPPRASAERLVDEILTPAAIEGEFAALEGSARVNGHALAMGGPYPVTLEKAARWAEGLEQRGLRLAPASALAVAR